MRRENDPRTSDGANHEAEVDRVYPQPSMPRDLAPYMRGVPNAVIDSIRVRTDREGRGYLQIGNSTTLHRLDSRSTELLVQRHAAQWGHILRPPELQQVMDGLKAYAQLAAEREPVWTRVAQITGGIEIDLGDDADTRVRITAGKVDVVAGGTSTLFYRPPTLRPFERPASEGDIHLLRKYLNLPADQVPLLIGLLSYWLGHAKVPTTNFPHLFTQGEHGSGKSVLYKLIRMLVDPASVDVQAFPTTEQDLAIATGAFHLAVFDNMRRITPKMADALCMTATGGSLSKRRLYTDAEMVSLRMHGPVAINSIHWPIDQPDLSQRCLFLTLKSLDDVHRRSEAIIVAEFLEDLPRILMGLFQLIADVFVYLPNVRVEHPERMIELSRWYAAMEVVDRVPTGTYQSAYSSVLTEGMRESLEENPLAAAVIKFIERSESGEWTGTPSALLDALDWDIPRRVSYSQDWPANGIALSKRLRTLQAALRRQGIDIRFHRGRERQITVRRIGGTREQD